MTGADFSLDIQSLHERYRVGSLTPTKLVDELLARMAGTDSHHIWITRLTRAQMYVYARALETRHREDLPLYGIPFAIKDNIDLAEIQTTAACPDYAYTPARSATVVQRLIDAGAIPVGKTNLDQFATGLVGTRTPYGACRNSFNPAYIAGGSSAGSAVAVALGQVSFALGTDTAGSGRVPAAFNNLIGLKPTRGLLSTRGVIPACRTLDCVSVFTLTAQDAQAVYEVAQAFDADDPYSRAVQAPRSAFSPSQFRFAVPRASQLEFFGNDNARALFNAALDRLESLGGEKHEIDFTPFLEAARLLYEGPWVAERYAAIQTFIETKPDSLHPVTRQILQNAQRFSAQDVFTAYYRLAELKRTAENLMLETDFVVTPTAGTIYRIDEVEAEPLRLNTNLGYYTNFMNLFDLSAIAAPAGMQQNGLPFGITFFAPAFSEYSLLMLAARWQQSCKFLLGATGKSLPPAPEKNLLPAGYVALAVCGAHLSGLPLNHQLRDRGGWVLVATRTAACYRLYALPGAAPRRPGLVRTQDGASIEVEVWALPIEAYGSFVHNIPAPLGIGTIELHDGKQVQGFVCESHALIDATDITNFGGWRAWLKKFPA
ncbi:MAG: allophanate hydrolase [Gammaproteobacteria bacterium]|nr:allophanate hydrolase [Gammaproteobacteria bacterium]